MLSGVRGILVQVLPFGASDEAAWVLRRRCCKILVLAILGLMPMCACVPMTPEAVIRAEQRAYLQAEREARFFREARACIEFGGFIVIERRGRASRRDELRRVPGDRDTWFCRM